MRDSARIDVMLAELRSFWLEHPDWRLGQIISNVIPDGFEGDPFYVEDDEMLAGLLRHRKAAENLPPDA